MKRRVWSLCFAAAALAACDVGEEAGVATGENPDRTGYEQMAVAADTSEGYEQGNIPAPVTPVQSGGTVGAPLTATGNLVGIEPNAPPGSIVVSEAGQGTQVSVKIDRYSPGSKLQVSFARGLCRQPGDVVHTVDQLLTISNEGFATLVQQIPVPTRGLLDGRHSVRVSTPGQGAPEFVLACANLPRAPLNPNQVADPAFPERQQ